jgi:hypothetical protein
MRYAEPINESNPVYVEPKIGIGELLGVPILLFPFCISFCLFGPGTNTDIVSGRIEETRIVPVAYGRVLLSDSSWMVLL